MPRYFFNSKDGFAHYDEDGTVLAGPAAARVHAIRYAGEVMASEPEMLWDGNIFTVAVCDQQRNLLFTVACQANDAPAAEDAD